jgi:hypothetical protein
MKPGLKVGFKPGLKAVLKGGHYTTLTTTTTETTALCERLSSGLSEKKVRLRAKGYAVPRSAVHPPTRERLRGALWS